MTTQKSPYLKHAELVLGNYSAGETLREFVVNLYSGAGQTCLAYARLIRGIARLFWKFCIITLQPKVMTR